MYDLMECRVSTVENLATARQPLPELEAIYLVSPTAASVEQICKDFENEAKNEAKPLYNSVHLYFLTRVADEQMAKIKSCKNLLKRVKNFAEVNLDFLAKESHSFHLDMPPKTCYRSLYNRTVNASSTSLIIANKLVTVCATLNEYPHIRYHSSSSPCTEIARIFHSQMNAFIANNDTWWYHGGQGHAERDRGTILLVDRADDPMTPVVHEFTYQAMCQDLLPM